MKRNALAVGGPENGRIVTGVGDVHKVWDKPVDAYVPALYGEAPVILKAEKFTYVYVWLQDSDNISAFWVPEGKTFAWAANQLALVSKQKTITRDLAVETHFLIHQASRHAPDMAQHLNAMERLRDIADSGR